MMSEESGAGMNFMAAVDYCRNLEESSFTNWRMPTPDEAIYLRANDATYSNIPTPTSTNAFWTYGPASDGTGGSTATVRGVIINFGSSSASLTSWANTNRARCVR